MLRWNQVKSGDDAKKQVSDDAKKAIAETTQLLENVVEQLSKSEMIRSTYETLKMRNQVHQVKEELIQELSKENGKDDTKLRNFAAKIEQTGHSRTQDLWRQRSSNSELPRMRRLPRRASQK